MDSGLRRNHSGGRRPPDESGGDHQSRMVLEALGAGEGRNHASVLPRCAQAADGDRELSFDPRDGAFA